MTSNGCANERAAAVAVVPADTRRAMIETSDRSDYRRHLSGRGTVMTVELLSVGTTVMRVTDLVVGAGVDLPHRVKIETGTGTVFAMTGTGTIGIGIEYETDNNLKETEITVIGAAAERGTAKENGIEMIIVADAPLLEIGVRIEAVIVTVNDLEREAVIGIETVSVSVSENENGKDPERKNKIANVTVIEKNLEKGIEIARESETGYRHPPNHTAAHPRGNGHGPEQAAAPPASSTSTATSRQQAVEVDPRVDGCALQTAQIDLNDLTDQNGMTADELIDIFPAVLLLPAENVRGSVKEIGSRKQRGMFRKGGVRIAVDDGNPNDLCTCTIIVGCIIGGLVYEREVYILISNDDDSVYRKDRQCIGRLRSGTDALYNAIQDEL